MSLTTRTGMRRCGKRWPTEDAALRSKKGLTGDYLATPCRACCGWHLISKQAITDTVAEQRERAAKAPRDTGPSRKVRAIVLERDGYACARCGKPAGPGIGEYSLQHRKARGVGGDSSIPNLLLLCGSATTSCHSEVEARKDARDLAAGYRLESWQTPGLEPVMYASPHGSGFTAWLAEDGSLLFEGPAERRAS